MLASLLPAYYHFLHYTSLTAPLTPAPEKFDLNALVDHTLRYYVESESPTALAEGDSVASILSQIEAAAKVWNDVPGSGLRLAFGGIVEPETPQLTPGLDIVFDEIPPGLIAMGGPLRRGELVTTENGSFIPIERSVVVLNQDLSRQPSWSDGFFLTLVHEMGHALGLQHTLTSALMSTSITRSVTKAKPLETDDVAGICSLYPSAGFLSSTGAITGRVVLGDGGVNLASVVALTAQGTVVSALSRPDGTYRIEGVPPGSYYVYVHPLPPPVYGEVSRANIVLPKDPEGNPIPVGPYFNTQFYPGFNSSTAATLIKVNAGETTPDIDFYVTQRGIPGLYAVTTYTFPAQIADRAAHLSLDTKRRYLVAWGVGLKPGMKASVIGGSAFVPENGLVAYPPDNRFVQINLNFNPFSGTGARHLVFDAGDDIYVLPAALRITHIDPPTITSLTPAVDEFGRAVVAVAGERLSTASRILFDGAAAKVVAVDEEGRLLVLPPPAPGSHRARVIALNADGQSSWLMDGLNPPVYEYPAAEAPAFTMVPSRLAPGAEAMVEIRGANTNFASEITSIGFGTSDVVVRDILVLDPGLILANVAVAPGAAEGAVSATVTSGLQSVTEPATFHILPPDGRSSLHAPVYDYATGKPVAYVGKKAFIRASSLPEEISPEALAFTINDKPMTVEAIEGDRIVFQVPADFQPVPMVARLTVNGWQAPAVLVRFAKAPPSVAGIYTEDGQELSETNAALPGELLRVLVADLGGPGETIDAERVRVIVNHVEHTVDQVTQAEGESPVWVVQFVLGTAIEPGNQVPVMVSVDGRLSQPVSIVIANPDDGEATTETPAQGPPPKVLPEP